MFLISSLEAKSEIKLFDFSHSHSFESILWLYIERYIKALLQNPAEATHLHDSTVNAWPGIVIPLVNNVTGKDFSKNR